MLSFSLDVMCAGDERKEGWKVKGKERMRRDTERNGCGISE